jgi:hypothetical protein
LATTSHAITFFTSHKLGEEVLKRKLTMSGTVRNNKPELPPQLLNTQNRPINSIQFVFTADSSLVSYMPKGIICNQEHPKTMMDYNATKEGWSSYTIPATAATEEPYAGHFTIPDISAYKVRWHSILQVAGISKTSF